LIHILHIKKLYAFTKIKYEEWTNETKALERKQVVSTVKKITAKAKNWMDGLQVLLTLKSIILSKYTCFKYYKNYGDLI
jgi:hypothetical protein